MNDLNTINQLDLTDIHRTLHQTAMNIHYFQVQHGKYRMYVSHKTNLNKGKKTKNIANISSDHSLVKL